VEDPEGEEVIGMTDEKLAYIGFIAKMLEGLDMRRIKIIYEFVLEMTG